MNKKYENNLLRNIMYLKYSFGLTQWKLADIIGRKRSTTAAILERRAEITIPDLKKLSDYFKISIHDLVKYDVSQVPGYILKRNWEDIQYNLSIK